MTQFGTNMKLTAARMHKNQLHTALTEGLGCKSMSPADDFSVYVFEDGFNLGVYFVHDGDALSDEQQALAPWLELIVTDIDGTGKRLQRVGVEVVPYERDREHTYYRLPGGPVFRLATA